jgi:hypothetical protein
MLRHITVLLALSLSTPGLAQSYNRAEIVRGLCQPDGCDEFAIADVERLTAAGDGTLLRTRVRTFHASHAGRKDLGEENGYVYCSPTRPAVLAEQDGQTMAFFLAPFASAESRESIRRNANYHAVYFTVCHGAEAGKAAVQNVAGTAQSFGYRVGLAQSKIATMNRPEDVMGVPERARREAPRDDAPAVTGQVVPPQVGRDQQERARELRMPGPGPATSGFADEDDGIFAVPRQITNQAFDALDQIGSWVLGR